jgi:WD40 repeat protein
LYSSTNLTTGKINEVDWSPDGKYISVASDVVTVYLFNTLTPIWSKNYTSFVTTAKFSKLGKLLAVGTNANDTVYIYNVPVFGQNATTNVFSNSSAHVY